MIRHLNHQEISKEQWDKTISRALNTRIYAYSWYLDIINPGWEALVEDEYQRIFPLTHHQKWGVPYLFQPFFAQQLGLFSDQIISHEKMTEFIQAIPDEFRFVEIQLNSKNEVSGHETIAKERVNYELDLRPPYTELVKRYAQNTRRNLKKAMSADLEVKQTVSPVTMVTLFRDHFGKQEGKLKSRHYAMMQQIIQEGIRRGKGIILGCYTSSGELNAAAFFISDQSRTYFLFAASSPAARENGAMFLLINEFVKNHSGQDLILDFEGGNDTNLGRFYKSFGAMEVPYPLLTRNRLPFVIKPLQRLKRKIKG